MKQKQGDYRTIKIKSDTHKILMKLRGYNGCYRIDDVIKFLLKGKK